MGLEKAEMLPVSETSVSASPDQGLLSQRCLTFMGQLAVLRFLVKLSLQHGLPR